MFRLTANKKNVNNYHVYNNNLSIWSDKKLIRNDDIIYSDEINEVYYFEDSYLIITENFQSSILINPILNINKSSKIDGIDLFFDCSTILYSKWNDDYSELFKLKYNIIADIVDWEINSYFGNPIILESEFYANNDNYIYKNDINNAQPLWAFDLGSLGEYKPIYGRDDERKSYQVSKFLGLWQNQLLVACDGGLILCLSTESGAIIRKWDTLTNNAEEGLKDVFRGYLHQSGNVFQLNKAGNKIIGLYYCHWVEICLETSNITTKHLKDAFDTHSISSFQTKSGYAEDETHLYSTVFLDQEKLGLNYMPTAICALNKETNQIDWLYRFDLDKTGDYVSVQIPQVSNEKLYQLTQNNVLHIFEKE